MKGFKGRLLGLLLGSVLSVTAIFFYLSPSSMSRICSIFPCQQIDENVIFLDRHTRYRYEWTRENKSENFSEHHSMRFSTTIPPAYELKIEGDEGPPLKMELARRRVKETSRDLWLFLNYQMKRVQRAHAVGILDILNQHEKIINYTLDILAEYHSAIEDQLKKLAENDGWNAWRKKEALELQEIVQRRLHTLQNPKNCETTPVLLCDLKNPHGFASGIHDILWCFIKAYYSRQRMVLDTTSWHYTPNGEWEVLFQPLTDTCANQTVTPASTGPGANNNKDRNLMGALPSDLGPRIIGIHDNPLAWWYGQFLMYLMRPNTRLAALLLDLKKEIDFNNTIVGVHVRRTDKIGSEAKGHDLLEYMDFVEDYYAGQEMIHPSIQRRIYLATDDPKVLTEWRSRFKEYVCFDNIGGASVASNIQTRYSNASLWGVITDIFMLANAEFLVCTFSSGVCRMAFELMQALHPEDVSDRSVSLDVQHHYAWLTAAQRKAIYNHRPKSTKEIGFAEGEVFKKPGQYAMMNEALKGKRNNGFANFVKSSSSGKEGLIPLFKAKEIYRFAERNDFTD